jgi:osmotically-inducible protein OsmY
MIRPLFLVAAAGAAFYFLAKGRRPRAARLTPDLEIEQRIRARLAEVVADPEGIHITVHGGNATLSGPVLPGERDRALAAVLEVPGVMQVTNLLEPVEVVPAQT